MVLKGYTEAQVKFPLTTCTICKKKQATERHHKDGNPDNNDPNNITVCCRRCHMELDGRLCKLAQQSEAALKARYGKFVTQCKICKKEVKPGQTRDGRCKTCASYWTRNGKERPFGNKDGRSGQGSKHSSSKLTEDQVREIKASLDTSTNAELAREYNVSWPTINKIRKGLRWSYIK